MHRRFVAAEADSGSACPHCGCFLKEAAREAVKEAVKEAVEAIVAVEAVEAVEADSGCVACADGGCAL